MTKTPLYQTHTQRAFPLPSHPSTTHLSRPLLTISESDDSNPASPALLILPLSLQWRPFRASSLRLLRFTPVVRRRLHRPRPSLQPPPPPPPLHWSPSESGRSMDGESLGTGDFDSGDPCADQWFSRPFPELLPRMLRKWRGFQQKNLCFLPWVSAILSSFSYTILLIYMINVN